MRARFAMCARKGFDAVEPDNMDGFENPTGFPITAAQQLTYDRWVARAVHRLGMAVFEKNDPEQADSAETATSNNAHPHLISAPRRPDNSARTGAEKGSV